MRRSEVFRAASEGAGINFLIAIGAGAVGGVLGPYGPSLLQASVAIGLGMYMAEKKPETAIAVASGGLLTASALATSVAARQFTAAAVNAEHMSHRVPVPFRPGYHLPQPFPGNS